MSFVERTLMIQKYIQYLRLIGLGKGRIFLHILIHVLDGVREFVVNIFAVSFYISCLQEGDGKRFFAGLLLIIPRLFEPPVRILRATLPDGGSHCKLLVLLNADYSMRYLL